MQRVLAGLFTLILVTGLIFVITRMSIATARRVWLVVFTVVLGSGVTMMEAHSFVAKWGFKGDSPRDGLIAMMDGTAYRPFVYRRLTPALVRVITDEALAHLPQKGVAYMFDNSALKRYRGLWPLDETSWTPRKAVAFHAAYAVVWASLFAALIAGAVLLQTLRARSWLEAFCTSALATCLVPLVFVGGGYMYDAPELLLFTVLLLVIARRWLYLAPVVFALMLLNKESALLVVPAVFPLFLRQAGFKRGVAWTGALGVMAVAWDIHIRHVFAANEGAPMEWWLPHNVEFWTNPAAYLRLAQLYTPGLPSPRGANVVLLLLAFLPLRFGWRAVALEWRWAMLLLAGVLVPLFVTSCFGDEMRNLILLYPLFFLIGVEGIKIMFQPAAAADPPISTAQEDQR